MNKLFELKIFPTNEDVCRAAAYIFTDLLDADGRNTFIVPGGKTPQIFYHCLVNQVHDWRDTTLMLSDERLVQENLPESNFGMIKRNLLDLIKKKTTPKLLPIVNGFSPKQSSQILKSFNSSTRRLLPPKAAFLGIGSDGHTASLFPGLKEGSYNKQPYILINRPSDQFQRISISQKILSETPLLIFLVAGKEKKTVLKKIVSELKDNVQLPIHSIIKSAQGKVIILCDQRASPE